MTADKAPVALVTGSTSGIGLAVARALAAAGYHLSLTGRDRQRGQALCDELQAAGAEALLTLTDIAKAGTAETLVEATCEGFGRIDLLVNNAGIIHRASVLETSDAQWDETLAVNLTAAFRLSRAVVPVMRAQGSGVILNIASDWGLVGGARAAAYCVSKGGLVQLTRCMALDHGREGIRVNAVCPGDVDTPMLLQEAHAESLDPAAYRRQSAEAIPDGRIATPEDVAALVVFLASGAARHITGAAIPVDGGSTAM